MCNIIQSVFASLNYFTCKCGSGLKWSYMCPLSVKVSGLFNLKVMCAKNKRFTPVCAFLNTFLKSMR